MRLPSLVHDGFRLTPARPAVPRTALQPGHLCRLQFEIGFADDTGRSFTHHQTLWVALTEVAATHCRGTLLEGPFLFVEDEDEILAPGTDLPFLPAHVADVLAAGDLGPEERAAAARAPRRRWAA